MRFAAVASLFLSLVGAARSDEDAMRSAEGVASAGTAAAAGGGCAGVAAGRVVERYDYMTVLRNYEAGREQR